MCLPSADLPGALGPSVQPPCRSPLTPRPTCLEEGSGPPVSVALLSAHVPDPRVGRLLSPQHLRQADRPSVHVLCAQLCANPPPPSGSLLPALLSLFT